MTITIPTKHIENTKVRFDGEYKWTLEKGIGEWIKRDLGVNRC